MEVRDMVRMANQIASFFRGYGHDEAVTETAYHINAFWEPRMRMQLIAHLDQGGEGLDPLVKDAAAKIRKPAPEAVTDFSLPLVGRD